MAAAGGEAWSGGRRGDGDGDGDGGNRSGDDGGDVLVGLHVRRGDAAMQVETARPSRRPSTVAFPSTADASLSLPTARVRVVHQRRRPRRDVR